MRLNRVLLTTGGATYGTAAGLRDVIGIPATITLVITAIGLAIAGAALTRRRPPTRLLVHTSTARTHLPDDLFDQHQQRGEGAREVPDLGNGGPRLAAPAHHRGLVSQPHPPEPEPEPLAGRVDRIEQLLAEQAELVAQALEEVRARA